MSESEKIVRRYTEVRWLVAMLKEAAITLLPPDSWEDKNDQLMLATYKDCKRLAAVRALCLTTRGETHHHWKMFSSQDSGVCIHFRRSKFIAAMNAAGVVTGEVKYLKLDQLQPETYSLEQLPFLKRFGFGDEGEFRALYTSKLGSNDLKKVPFDLDVIEKVTLHPSMSKANLAAARSELSPLVQRAGGEISVLRSSLTDSRRWRAFAMEYRRLHLPDSPKVS